MAVAGYEALSATATTAAIRYPAVMAVGVAVADSQNPASGLDSQGLGSLMEATPRGDCPNSLFHYTTVDGLQSILSMKSILPSLWRLGTKDVRYGNGQYLSDILPGTKTGAQLSQLFVRRPYFGSRFTNYVEIDVTGLTIINGRPHVFVVPNTEPLDISNLIISSGAN